MDVIIVGGGIAGLTAATRLVDAGKSVIVFEAGEQPGGRVRSTQVDDSYIDHGFQVFLTAYPRCSEIFDFPSLELGTFRPGAAIRLADGQITTISDPLREPLSLFPTLFSSVGTFLDKLRILRLRWLLQSKPLAAVWKLPNISTLEWLRKEGFSEKIIDRFFRPFLGGVFLDRNLETTARMFGFVFRCFSTGKAALPKKGIQSLPNQLVAKLPENCLRLNSRVHTIEGQTVTLDDGSRWQSGKVLVATDLNSARQWAPSLPKRTFHSTTATYFRAINYPNFLHRRLFLNSETESPLHHVAVPTSLFGETNPIISLNTIGKEIPDTSILHSEAVRLFGPVARQWELIEQIHVENALPRFNPEDIEHLPQQPLESDQILFCGDMLTGGSLELAVQSAMEAVQLICRKS